MKTNNLFVKWMAGLLGLCAVFGAGGARAAERETVDGVDWKYVVWEGQAWLGSGPNDRYGSLTVWTSTTGDIEIPATLGGYSVVGIGMEAFKSCKKITSITIPNSVADIGEGAFIYCSGLESVEFGAGVENIGRQAFHRCLGLTSLQIEGNGQTRIGEEAFNHCESLRAVDIGSGVESIGVHAFRYCYNLERVDICGVGTIESNAFSYCTNVTAVYVEGNGETTIGAHAFNHCEGLETLEIGDGVQSIGSNAFSRCFGLKSVTIEGNGATSIGNWAFAYGGTSGEETVEIGDGVKSIGEWAFAHSDGLETVVIGDGATNIGRCAFYECGGLQSVEIGPAVREIGNHAFYNCSGLEELAIPDNVASLGTGMCRECTGLKTVKIGNGVQEIGGSVFLGCDALQTVYVPASWKGSSKLKKLKLPKGCTVVYGGGAARQTVRFDANGGWCGTAEEEYAVGKAYGTLPVASWAGHAFLGWWTEKEGGTQVTAGSRVESVTTLDLWAHWTAEQEVAFNANGGTCGTPMQWHEIGGKYGELPEATRKGYAFAGWWTAKTGGTKVVEGTTVVPEKASRTLYARWTTKQTVTFNANGGTCGTRTKGYTIGKAYGSLPAATWAGRAFVGWATAADGGTMVTKADKVTGEVERTLYAQWTTTQAVTFDANGGSCGTSRLDFAIAGIYGSLPVATKTGQAFTGWWTAKSGGTKVTEVSRVTASPARILHAQWTKSQTAKFNANGGKCGTPSKTYTIGKLYGSLPKATKAGAGFVGWTDARGVPVTTASLVTEETLRTLFAQWTTTQTVTFDANGGNCGTPRGEFAIGSAYGELPVATKAGQAFVGWYTAKKDGTKVTAASKATEAATRTLYAHWTAKQTAKFNANGGKCGTSNKTYTIGKAYGSLPTATKKGYGHFGWADAAAGGNAVTTASLVTEETPRTLYAQWTTNQVVTFDANGGECEQGRETFVIGKAYGELPVATKGGNACTGWYTAKKDGTKVTEASKATEVAKRTLYAHWTTKQTAKFNANGGKCGTSSKTYTIGKAYGSLPKATKKGYGHFGWVDAAGNAVMVDSLVTEETPRTLYAEWTTMQVVAFDANGGHCGTESASFEIGKHYGDLPLPVKENQGFTGWYTAKKDGTKVTAASKATEAATRTLYAHWMAKQTVKFNANGGKCPMSSKTYNIGNTYGSLPTPTLKGHTFTGWVDAATDGTRVTAADLVTAEAARTLWAQWDLQAVRFNANGGTCRKSTADFVLGGTYGELPVPERNAHVFRGWWTAPEGGTEVTSGMAVSTDTARTLYAHWAHVESLEVTSVSIKARDAGGTQQNIRVGFTAMGGTTYVLQQTKSLVPADWQTLAEKTPEEDGETSFDEAVPAALDAGGFFRVELKD